MQCFAILTGTSSTGLMNRSASVLFLTALVCLGACGQTESEQPVFAEFAQSKEGPVEAMAEEPHTQPEPVYNQADTTNYYEITTPQGRMVVRLYDETPKHRDNFRKIVAEGVLDSTLFHRVIRQFMIQGGDPNSKDDDPYNDGNGGPGYTVPAEFDDRFFHKKGALAAARQPDQGNPERESSGSQFYIVHGRTWSDSELEQLVRHTRQRSPDFSIPAERRAIYASLGGAPFLDGTYTVFGELVAGFDVLDAIASTPTTGDSAYPLNRPLTDVRMTVRPLFSYVP